MDEFEQRRRGVELFPSFASDGPPITESTAPRNCTIQSVAAVGKIPDSFSPRSYSDDVITRTSESRKYILPVANGTVSFYKGRALFRASDLRSLKSDVELAKNIAQENEFNQRILDSTQVIRVVVGFSVEISSIRNVRDQFESTDIIKTSNINFRRLQEQVVCHTCQKPTVRVSKSGTVLISKLSSLEEAESWTKRVRLALRSV